VCVTRLLDEPDDTELARDRLVLLLRRTAKVRAPELSLPGRLAFDRRDDDLRQRQRSALPRHVAAPFGDRMTVIVRPSKLSRPCG